MAANRKERKPRLISLGAITKVRGNKGEVAVALRSRYKEQYDTIKKVVLRAPNEADCELAVENLWFHGEKLILKFKGCDSIEQAEKIVGYEVLISEGEFKPPGEGYHYVFDLLGMKVYSAGGDFLGKIEDVMYTGGTDILIVKKNGKEYLIPMAEEYLKELDFKNKKLTIELPEGLLEINEG